MQNMKKIITVSNLVVLLGFVFIGSGMVVNAETSTSDQNEVRTSATVRFEGKDTKIPVVIRSAQQQKLDATRESADKMEKLNGEEPKDRVGFVYEFKNRFEKTIKLLESVHSRLTGISERISNRIEKLSLGIAESTESKKYLAAANEDLRKAKAEIEMAVNTYTKEVETKTTTDIKTRPTNIAQYIEDNFSISHSHIKAARELLKSAHKNLVLATNSLKPAVGKIRQDQIKENPTEKRSTIDGGVNLVQ